MKNKFIKLPLFLAAVTLIFTVLLSFVYQITNTVIKDRESLAANAAYVELFEKYAGATVTGVESYTVTNEKAKDKKYDDIVKTVEDGKTVVGKIVKDASGVVGYAFSIETPAYKGAAIKFTIAFDKTEKVLGIAAVDVSTQTKGFGSKFGDEANIEKLVSFLKANPNQSSYEKADAAQVVAGATETGKGFFNGFASARAIISEIKGA